MEQKTKQKISSHSQAKPETESRPHPSPQRFLLLFFTVLLAAFARSYICSLPTCKLYSLYPVPCFTLTKTISILKNFHKTSVIGKRGENTRKEKFCFIFFFHFTTFSFPFNEEVCVIIFWKKLWSSQTMFKHISAKKSIDRRWKVYQNFRLPKRAWRTSLFGF